LTKENKINNTKSCCENVHFWVNVARLGGRDVAMQRLYMDDYPRMSNISPKSGSLVSATRSFYNIREYILNNVIN